MEYDEYMDKECIALCDALNELKGIETNESCCGHLNTPYMVFMKCNDFYSLAILGRVFDKRYSSGKWILEVITDDSPKEGFCTFDLFLHTEKPFASQDEMNGEIAQVIQDIKAWSSTKYKNHLMGTENEKETARLHL